MLQQIRQLQIAVGIVLVDIRDGQTAAAGGGRVVLLCLTLQDIALEALDGQPDFLQRVPLLRQEHGGRAQQLLTRQMRGYEDLQPLQNGAAFALMHPAAAHTGKKRPRQLQRAAAAAGLERACDLRRRRAVVRLQ